MQQDPAVPFWRHAKQRLFSLGIFMTCFLPTVFSQDIELQMHTAQFNQLWQKTLISIEVSTIPAEELTENSPTRPIGSGFLVQTPNKHYVLVTAKHVVFEDEGAGPLVKNLVYRMNGKGKSRIISDKYVTDFTGKSWLTAPNDDIAIRFISVFDEEVAISYGQFLPSEKVEAGAPLFIVGYPMGLRSTEYSRPIVRRGMVARADSDGIIADSFVFPGNSGGPAIYEPPIQLSTTTFRSSLLQGEWFVGMVTSYLPYTDIAISPQTKRARITFEENSGLCNIIPADRILSVLRAEKFMALDSR